MEKPHDRFQAFLPPVAETGPMTRPAFYVGKARDDQLRDTGWFVGQFVPASSGLRHQTDVELKWGMHADGDRRVQPAAYDRATTVSILISGSIGMTFGVGDDQQSIMLRDRGDYVIFGPGVTHAWEAIGETTVLTVRFPSLPKDTAA